MANYNPSAPDTVGTEFLPHAGSSLAVQGDNGWAVAVAASVTETIQALRIAGSEGDVTSSGLIADIYAGAPTSSVPGAVGTRVVTSVFPTADVARQGWTTHTGGTSNLWATVDNDPASTAADSDGVRDPALVIGDSIQWRFGGLSSFPAGRRITEVKVRLRVGGGNVAIRFFGLIGGSDRRFTGYTGAAFRLVEFTFGEVCPWAGRRWTTADVADLASGSAVLSVERADSTGGFLIPQVTAAQIQITHYAETRVAVGAATFFAGDTYDLGLSPPGDPEGLTGTSWPKVAGTTYWIVLRRYRLPGAAPAIGWRSLLAEDAPATIPARAQPVTITDGLPAVTGAATLQAPGFHLLTDADDPSTGSVDSQPYGFFVADANLTSAGANNQRFTPGASGNYGVMRALVRPPADDATTRLKMEIRRVSDDALMGVAAEVSVADALSAPERSNGWRLIQVMGGGTLVAGTAYRVALSLVGGTAPWRVGLVVGIAGPTVVSNPGGFQGTTGYATVNGSTTVNVAKTVGTIPGQAQTADWLVQVGLLPDPLTSASAVVESLPLAPPRAPGIG